MRKNGGFRLFCAAALMSSLLLAGCTGGSGAPEATEMPRVNPTTPVPENTESDWVTEPLPEMDDEAVAALVSLRQALVGTPQSFAVAYFGYALGDGGMPADPYAVMEGAAPQLCENLPFLLQIPEENTLGKEGHLLCVVPADENATVAVNWRPWDEATETYGESTVLYRSETGDPILLLTENTHWKMETEVVITDSQGNVTVWYPLISLENRIAPLCDDDGASVFYDFSHYDRLSYEDLLGGVPEEMAGTWELVWTEVEGDLVAADPGDCMLEITAEGEDSFRISYRDRNFPESDFSDRELTVAAGEMYPGCGNNQWIAQVGAESGDRISYGFTVLDDGMLLLQHSWEMEGMPMVSYGWYQRIF